MSLPGAIPLGFLPRRVSPEKQPSHHPVLLRCLCWLLETLISPRSRHVTVLNGTDKPPPRELIAGRVSRGRTAVMLSGKETSLLIQIAYCCLLLNEKSQQKPVRQYPPVCRGIPAKRAALNLQSACARLDTRVRPEGPTCIVWGLVLAQWSQNCFCLRIRK